MWNTNKRFVVVCVLGTFWCSITAVMILIADWTLTEKPYDVPPPLISPCLGHFCAFHGRCGVNKTDNSAYCTCIDDCDEWITSPVCGTDVQTYSNECNLHLASCYRQRRIRVAHEGECKDPCDGKKCEGRQICRLNDEREAMCMCDASCEPIMFPVCGSDGRTYSNECLLRQMACTTGRDITIHYQSECRENEEVLSKFATRADSAVLKKLKVKPSLAPEQLFALPLVEESSTGKRKPKQSEKMKESEEQEIELLLPKKKKKPEASSKEEQSIKKKEKEEKNLQKKKKKEVSSKNEKKNNQDSTELHSAVLMTAMLDQFMESSTSVSDKPVSENSQSASVSGEPNVTQATVDKPVSKNCQSASVSGEPNVTQATVDKPVSKSASMSTLPNVMQATVDQAVSQRASVSTLPNVMQASVDQAVSQRVSVSTLPNVMQATVDQAVSQSASVSTLPNHVMQATVDQAVSQRASVSTLPNVMQATVDQAVSQSASVSTLPNVMQATVKQAVSQSASVSTLPNEMQATVDQAVSQSASVSVLPNLTQNTSLLDTWGLCNDALVTTRSRKIPPSSNKIPVPSQEVLEFLKCFSKPEVLNFMKSMANHFEDEGCTHVNNECFQIDSGDANSWGGPDPDMGRDYTAGYTVLADLSYQQDQPDSPHNFSYGTRYAYQTPYSMNANLHSPGSEFQQAEYAAAKKVPEQRRTVAFTTPTDAFTTPGKVAASSRKKPVSTPPGPVCTSPRRSPRKISVSTPACTSPRRSPRKISVSTPVCTSQRRSPRKISVSTPVCSSPPTCTSPDNEETQDLLLKKFPDVKIQPAQLTSAISAARKSQKSGYTLCYNLIKAVCTLEELACSRGQGLTKRKEGDFRPDLDKNKCSAVKEDNLCTSLQCGPSRECIIDRTGAATCACPSPCQQVMSPVCGSDGVTYDSACELRRQACLRVTQTSVSHSGPCEDQGPCLGHSCDYDADCVVIEGRPTCECPTCKDLYDPVCGKNGIPYENECKMRLENCQEHQYVQAEHRGLCSTLNCDKNKTVCQHYSTCEVDENGPRCICPSHCEQGGNKVCGSNGVTYESECELRVASCVNHMYIYIASFGSCEDCNGIQCKYGAKCVNRRCVCPVQCHSLYEPVCASDDKTYRNECEMSKEMCRKGIELEIIKTGECDDPLESGSGEGSGEQTDCDETPCQYGGICQLSEDGLYRCICSFSCDAIRSPVCGSNGITYGNQCDMQAESCHLQKHITVQFASSCDDLDEILCDGMEPVKDRSRDMDYTCTHGNDCPAGSYCHEQFGKCCHEERMMDLYVRDCTEGDFGCCADQETMALGPDQAGCPDQCQCNALGSFGTTCHPSTKQCSCKPGVRGLRCDRCLQGYWGLHLIQENNNMGCMSCNCNKLGASRSDCHQMTGRCMCNEGYEGLKCGRCKNTGSTGQHGCNNEPKSCRDLNCRHGAICSDILAYPQCICEISCPNHDFPAMGYVCGSNGITYSSECRMRKDACLKQINVRISRYGRCEEDLYTLEPTAVPFTTRSRKTTRHIHASNYMTNMTPKKPKSTPRPQFKDVDFSIYGRIGDLCLEDSYCFIPHSHCRLALCQCDAGYIPTMGSTQCSEVQTRASEGTEHIPDNINTCTLNPCLNMGKCILDDNLGYRCLCALGWEGTICKQRLSFTTPSFSGSSYLILTPLGNISGDFYLDMRFHSMNKDGILLFSSQYDDGTGQFISIAISNGHVEFRYDMGSGPVQIRHPNPISVEEYHQVIAKKLGERAMLIVDDTEPIAAISIGSEKHMDLSGKLYLGYLPQNLSFIQEKIGVNMGFVGCIQSMTAGHMDVARIYNLEYPNTSSQIVDGQDVSTCDKNPCKSIPCLNGGTCTVLNMDIYECFCPKGYSGSNCEGPVDRCTQSPCHTSATCSISSQGEIICHCPDTREGQYCEYEKLAEISVPEFWGNSYLILPVPESLARHMSMEVWFLTHNRNGVLLFSSQFLGGLGDFISVNIIDLYVVFSFDLGDGPVHIKSTVPLVIGEWHKLSIQRTNRDAELVIDDGLPYRGSSQGSLTELQFSGSLYVGGYKDKFDLPPDANITHNFTGVIQRIYINGRLVESMVTSALESDHVTSYNGAPCNYSPCMNGGVCIPMLHKAECRCPKRYSGKRCEKVAENLELNSPVRFNGKTYLQYFNEITSGHAAQKTNKFQLRFRSHQSSGMLLFLNKGAGITGDYLTVVISRGNVVLSYNLGKQSSDKLLEVRSTVYVSDGKWHTVYMERDHRECKLQVDKESIVTGTSLPGAIQLDTDGDLWIGGKSDLPWGLPEEYYKGFKGCLGDVFINDRELQLFDYRNGPPSGNEFCH